MLQTLGATLFLSPECSIPFFLFTYLDDYVLVTADHAHLPLVLFSLSLVLNSFNPLVTDPSLHL